MPSALLDHLRRGRPAAGLGGEVRPNPPRADAGLDLRGAVPAQG